MQPVAVVLGHGIELLSDSIEQLAVDSIVVSPLAGGLVLLTFSVRRDPTNYLHLVNCLAAYNCWAFDEGLVTGSVYDGRVRYEKRNYFEGREMYQSAPALYAHGRGDCADLVAARCAEPDVFHAGGQPRLDLSHVKADGGVVYHATITYPNGDTEDPSAHLGMPARCQEARRSA